MFFFIFFSSKKCNDMLFTRFFFPLGVWDIFRYKNKVYIHESITEQVGNFHGGHATATGPSPGWAFQWLGTMPQSQRGEMRTQMVQKSGKLTSWYGDLWKISHVVHRVFKDNSWLVGDFWTINSKYQYKLYVPNEIYGTGIFTLPTILAHRSIVDKIHGTGMYKTLENNII